MNILVTGGTGFLGGYVMAALLASGHNPLAYDVAAPAPEILSVMPSLPTCLRGGGVDDLARLLEVCRSERIDAIIHLAAKVGFASSLNDPIGFYSTNVMGTVNVCEAARRLGVPKVLLISSNSAYQPGAGSVLKETDPVFSIFTACPTAHYGTSKLAAEAIGLAYADFHDVDILALRVTAIYGFGMRSPLSIKPMVENAVRGTPIRLADGGSTMRDYTHVLDCSGGIVRALEAMPVPKGQPRVINISASRICTGLEIASIVRSIVPAADIEIGNNLSTPQEQAPRSRLPLGIGLAKRVLDWSPQWPIERGIAEYVDRFRQHLGQQSARSG